MEPHLGHSLFTIKSSTIIGIETNSIKSIMTVII